jgi:hypothetical protein
MNSDIIKNKYCERVKEILKYTDIAIFSDSIGKRLCHRGHIHDTMFDLNNLNFGSACSIEITNIGIEIIEPGMSVNESRYLFDVEKDVYDDFKKVIDDRDDMHSFVYSVAGFTDDENAKVYFYFNKNKFKLSIDFDPWSFPNTPDVFFYYINFRKYRESKEYITLVVSGINYILACLDSLKCEDEVKLEYYKELAKRMSKNRAFKKRCNEIASFDDKLKVIAAYKSNKKG